MQHSYRWRSHPNVSQLERNLDELRTTVIQLRRELTTKEGYAAKLELVVRQRSRTIDALRGQLERARAANELLDRECERLAEMVRFAPQLDAAMLSPK
jgi:predicted RNase H-like nuclease (RuvC/YqgF family)